MRLLACLLLMAVAPSAAASGLGAAARAADVVVEGRVAGAADEFGLTPVEPGRAAKRPGPLPPSLLVRFPASAPPGSSWLLFLVPDGMGASLGAWTLVDPDYGAVPLDGRAGSRDDLLALADLAIAPPQDEAALAARLSSLIGRGDAPTAFALSEFAGSPSLLRRVAPDLAPRLRTVLAARSVSPPTAALAVQALGSLGQAGDDVRLVDLVAGGAPEVVVSAAAQALATLATPATAEHIEHALGSAPSFAAPGLVRLAAAARAHALVPRLCEMAGSSRPALREAVAEALLQLRASCADHP